METQYYEVHVTFDAHRAKATIENISYLCQSYGFWVSNFSRDEAGHPVTIATIRGTNFDESKDLAYGLKDVLTDLGVKVTRVKIEATLLDERSTD